MKKIDKIFWFISWGVFTIGLFCIMAMMIVIDKKNAEVPTEPIVQVVEVPIYIEVPSEPEIIERIIVEDHTEYIEVAPQDYDELKQFYADINSKLREHQAYMNTNYNVANTIWLYLKNNLGMSDYVAAGIIGNMMNEAGGNTLKIQPSIYGGNKGYYGICQWSLKYSPSIADKSLGAQLDFLASNIESTFNTWGKLYKSGFKYEDFLKMTDCKEAALAFAKCYERCGTGSYSVKQSNALKAYQSFVINVYD